MTLIFVLISWIDLISNSCVHAFVTCTPTYTHIYHITEVLRIFPRSLHYVRDSNHYHIRCFEFFRTKDWATRCSHVAFFQRFCFFQSTKEFSVLPTPIQRAKYVPYYILSCFILNQNVLLHNPVLCVLTATGCE